MHSTKAWYWVAAGVLALGLNSEYQHGRLQWAHRAVERGQEFASCLETSSHGYLAIAKLMFGNDPAPEVPGEVVMAQVQEKMDVVQQKLERKRIQIENVETINERVEPAMIRAQAALQNAQMKIDMAQMKAANRAYICPRMRKMTFTVLDVPNVKTPRFDPARFNGQRIPKIAIHVPDSPVMDLSDVPGVETDDTL